MGKYLFKLYVIGGSRRSQKAIANIFLLCKKYLHTHYSVEIIDVLEQPEEAEKNKILVTPTLVKEFPRPSQKIIGDLSNLARVTEVLDLAHYEEELQQSVDHL